uniref:Uncharacterized protein n=1 Tax=Rhodopseudomonas palustris (strain BisA53) TaxID=316055 RepID=Q07P30_RHOP5
MTTKRSDVPSPVGVARAQQQRLAAEERTKVMAEAEQNAVAVRKNMDRLRTLRLAKEAEDALAPPVVVTPKKRAKKVPAK